MKEPTVLQDLPMLPFRIRPAWDESTLRKAATLRKEAYGRHLPQFSSSLGEPEPADTQQGCVLFVAESRLDESILGSVRVQTNFFAPLPIEKSIVLPGFLSQASSAECVRLCVLRDRPGNMVKAMLCKAYFMFCAQERIEHLVVAARSPLDRQYEAMGFTDICPGSGFSPMAHIGDIPHRALSQPTALSMEWLRSHKHPFYDIFSSPYDGFDISLPPGFYGENPDPIERPMEIQADRILM